MEKKLISLNIRIDWSELDTFGHVNNVVFYRYIQSARVRFWEQIGLYDKYERDKIAPLLANAAIDFKKPLYYPGNVIIEYQPTFIKNTSFGLEYKIKNDNMEIVAIGKDIMVLFDFKENLKMNIPDFLRKNIQQFK